MEQRNDLELVVYPSGLIPTEQQNDLVYSSGLIPTIRAAE